MEADSQPMVDTQKENLSKPTLQKTHQNSAYGNHEKYLSVIKAKLNKHLILDKQTAYTLGTF